MRWFWGFLLIFLGVLFLGDNFGWWDGINFSQFWALWPVLIILFGIAVIFRNWKFGWIIILLSFLALVAFIISVPSQRYVKNSNREVSRTEISEGLPANVTSGEIEIDTGAVDLNVSETSSKFVEGTFESNIMTPQITVERNNEKIKAVIDSVQRTNFHFGGNYKNRLDLKLADSIPLLIKLNSGASDLNIDLKKIILKSLDINAGASSIDIDLGDKIENGANVAVKAGASSIKISVPENIGVELFVKAGASGKDFEGMDKIDNNHYKSQGFDQSEKKINIRLEAGVSSLKLERK